MGTELVIYIEEWPCTYRDSTLFLKQKLYLGMPRAKAGRPASSSDFIELEAEAGLLRSRKQATDNEDESYISEHSSDRDFINEASSRPTPPPFFNMPVVHRRSLPASNQ
eukprot:6458700-Amphidinium_carterae.1